MSDRKPTEIPMITKQITGSVLLIVLLGCLAIWGNRWYHQSLPPIEGASHPPGGVVVPVIAGHQVVMTYFISGPRCESCQKIEALCRATAAREFPTELANHQLVFRVIDTGEPANQHYLNDYQLTSKIVILSHRLEGRETEWVAMEKVWDLLEDPAAFGAYLAAPIRTYIHPRDG